jgi:sec-independent protein translocase protein TatB
MFDVGLGEMLILAIAALLVFGPERLPKAVAQFARQARDLREMAATARRGLADAAGPDLQGAQGVLADIKELHPRRLLKSVLDEPPVETLDRQGGRAPE